MVVLVVMVVVEVVMVIGVLMYSSEVPTSKTSSH